MYFRPVLILIFSLMYQKLSVLKQKALYVNFLLFKKKKRRTKVELLETKAGLSMIKQRRLHEIWQEE